MLNYYYLFVCLSYFCHSHSHKINVLIVLKSKWRSFMLSCDSYANCRWKRKQMKSVMLFYGCHRRFSHPIQLKAQWSKRARGERGEGKKTNGERNERKKRQMGRKELGKYASELRRAWQPALQICECENFVKQRNSLSKHK